MSTTQPELTEYTREISSLVSLAASEITPNYNYRLTVCNIPLAHHALRSIEHQFGISLNQKTGTDISLSVNPVTDQLRLDRLSIPTDKHSGMATLYRTDTLGFVPSYKGKQDDHEHFKSLPIVKHDNDELLDALTIQQPISLKTPAYIQWKSDLLDRSKGWVIEEQVEYIEKIDESSQSVFRIKHGEDVGEDASTTTSSVERIITIPGNTPSQRRLIVDALAEVQSDGYSNKLVTATAYGTYDPSYTATLLGQEETIERFENVPLNQETRAQYVDLIIAALRCVREAKE